MLDLQVVAGSFELDLSRPHDPVRCEALRVKALFGKSRSCSLAARAALLPGGAKV
jgi:hypothetical protein